ncbi:MULTISPECIES: HAD family hydrolase [Streptomyces]|uniref:Haloacid dehalogenase superfamily, subfamily IA, variant 3 with third motif having DD or ED/haloacid dehalogenase superfamily, subfamily IA, variant 1 with third motif having Dx(3-4)D or Dx(3-4)E n=1 Tax=Streptomyces misionensis TaxID=67331 RepID=A0A1H5GCR0_9ACTN|nr:MULTISPECIES: HAD family hydrolase [Streptomyces]SEE13527.1 haloacid dehalogenase superfamily, subfamily IA, variant 3 with third motif having DD or ED/haloacid dehalogenase superfamily, subfamily IA, variant 1 with third motif having Dx(3-4)D or Dx(3-4)E [Streptomyces misionensis]SFY48471.1 Pyrophosphatase PpaX [Streptomyces sp. F-1]
MERAAVFDVDGTLVDTNHLHVVTWWEAFRQAGHDVPMHAVHRAVGLGSSDLIAHLLGEDRDREQDDALSAAHKALYGQYFDRLPALPGAGELLRRLHHDGWTVVLATSASGSELGALRRAIDADDAIADTASSDDVQQGKPAPEPVEHALELAGVPASRAVFVGDTVWDMRAGAKAGVRCVGVLCGGLPRADLEEAGAEAVYADPADLLDRLDTSPFA